jgi:dynein light intermediate chain 1
MLHNLLKTLPPEAITALEENIEEWRDRKRNDFKEPSSTTTGEPTSAYNDADVALPLGPGEWDLPLGIPLCVVCQNSNQIEVLEKDLAWKDRHFDFIQQFLRTVLLKHGGSLIYTMPHLPESNSALQKLIHSSLGIQSMLQKQTLKHNTTNRDHILVPPNFDSFGKIRILTEDFNIDDVSEAWTRDISGPDSSDLDADAANILEDGVGMYEEVIQNPAREGIPWGVPKPKSPSGLEVEAQDTQEFLAQQAGVLDDLSKEDEKLQQMREGRKTGLTGAGDVEEHIGPVQFNMGGIQMDAEDMVKRLKVCFLRCSVTL